MKPETHPVGHPSRNTDPKFATVLHGHIDLYQHPQLTQQHLGHVVEKTYTEHVMNPMNKFNNVASHRSKLVVRYHGGSLTNKIHLSTIPSHASSGPGNEHTLRHKLNDPAHMAIHAPMLHHAVKATYDSKREGNPYVNMDTYPHAEAGALYKFERNIHKLHPNATPEERRNMALRHFQPENLKTYGSRKRGDAMAHEPCDYQCQWLLRNIKDHKEELRRKELGRRGVVKL